MERALFSKLHSVKHCVKDQMTFSTEQFLTLTVSCHEAFSICMNSCSVGVQPQGGLGGAATLRAYKSGDVDYLEIDD